ncbi:MAG: PQQ-binding-like beta-propeller repeat protein [Planctomicrobium sp.]|jgi:outer membrane protein assembly factor BamB|nr:PQQ-binding-like beta-propeller repeat protein [Planctomicrobium sp.]
MSLWLKGNPFVVRMDQSINWQMPRPFFSFLILVLFISFPMECQAQFNPPFPITPAGRNDAVSRHLERLPRDPLSISAFYRAKSAIEEGEITDGLEALQGLIESSSDFFQIENQALGGSFHAAVEQEIAANREDYERLFGATANQLFEEAMTSKDLEKLTELVRRFRFTNGGQKAIKFLGHLNADEGDLTAANRVLASSVIATTTDVNFKETYSQIARYLALSGQESELLNFLSEIASDVEFDVNSLPKLKIAKVIEAEGETELYDWMNPHGGLSSTGQTPFAPAMFSDAWTQPLIDQYDFFLGDAALEKARLHDAQEMAQAIESRVWSQAKRSAFPAGRALIVDGRVIVPGYASVKSFDLETGEIDGVGVNVDQSFEYLHEFTAAPSLMNDSFREKIRNLFFSLRGWRDLSSTSLSSDGKYVYTVSDCQLAGSVAPEFLARSRQRHELLPQAFNQLHAFELKAGLRNRWSVGTVDENAYLPFGDDQGLARNIFFYGAPLPHAGHLYIIGEESGQIQLYEIDRETGAVVWSIGLLDPSIGKNIVQDSSRRMAGIMPAYVKGLLVCPTGEGVITAIDPLSRKVVWSHQYEKSQRLVDNRFMFRRGIPNRETTVEQFIKSSLDDDRWFDQKVVTAGEYVLHTPSDSDELICLNALDGSKVWDDEVFRLRSLYMASVYDQSLILVGQSDISAMNLADASRIWSSPIPPPSGRGVRMGNRFLQPLMTGEILIIDLSNGRQLARSPMAGARVIGNLTAAHGHLVAMSGTEVVAFQSMADLEQTLAQTEDESHKNSLRGELLLQQGERTQALKEFTATDLNELPERGKTVLAWTKLDGLEHDFEQYKVEADEIEKLLTSDQQRYVFLKAMATGLKQSGDQLGAFDRYLDLFEQLSNREILRDIDGLHELSEQRWALAELQSFFNSDDEDLRDQLQSAIQAWLNNSSSEKTIVSFLKSFPLSELDEKFVLERTQSSPSVPESTGAISSIYERLRNSSNPEIASAANLQMALLALRFKDGIAAELYLEKLKSFDAIPAFQTESASLLAETTRANPDWSEQFNGVPVWPEIVTESEKVIPYAKSTRSQIPVIGPVSVPLNGWTFFLNPMGSEIDVYDQHGRRQCQLSTGVVSIRSQIGSSLGRYVEVRGQRALVVLADRFILIDFQQRKDRPRIITTELLITEDQNPYGTDTFVDQSQAPRIGFRTFRSPSPIGTPAGNVGSLTKSILCFGRGSQLTAIDPDQGQVLWRRHDLPMGSEIFCDEEYVLTMVPGERTLTTYRSVDGSFVGKTEVPEGAIDSVMDRENGDWGRYFPVVKNSAESFEFSLYDPVQHNTLWKFQSQPGTTWTTVGGQDLAFLSPNKKLTIVEGISGKEALSKTIPVSSEVKSLTVLTYRNQWVVFPGTGPPLNYDFSYPSLITRLIEETVHGTVFAIDQTSKEILWTQAVNDQKMTTQVPNAWPVLIFGNSSGRKVAGLVLNRLTGAVIIDEEWDFDRSWIHWQATIQPMRILIGYGRKTVTLNCTEDLSEPINSTEEEPVPTQPEEGN